MSLRLPVAMLASILRHAEREHPLEACGVIGGSWNGTLVEVIPMVNAEQSADVFRMDPEQQLLVWQDLEHRGLRPVVLYHTHTGSPAEPSSVDRQYSQDPLVHYLIVSTRDAQARSWVWRDGDLFEEPLDLDV